MPRPGHGVHVRSTDRVREQIGKLAQRSRPVHAADVELRIAIALAPDAKGGRVEPDGGNVSGRDRLEAPLATPMP